MEDKQKLLAGGVAAVVLAAGVFIATQGNSGSTCKLTSAGVGLILEGVSKGRSTNSILTSAGVAVGTDIACEELVNAWKDGKSSEFEVETTEGSKTIKASLPELTAPAPLPTPTSDLSAEFRRIIACTRWQPTLLQQWCYDGKIAPPA